MKRDKSVAGLTIFLSLIVMLFVIGLLVMIFTIMGTKLKESQYLTATSVVVNETIGPVNTTTLTLTRSTYRDSVCAITTVTNYTSGTVITSGNYTLNANDCTLVHATSTGVFNNTIWNVTYSVTFSADTEASNVINDTGASLATSTDFFDIFIVVGAMVVLILLTVLIITAIRGSGLISSGSA